MSLGYIFGGDTGETQASLARKRAIAEAMLERSTSRVPQNVGEGLTSLGQALAGRMAMNRLNKHEAELNSYNTGLRGRLGPALFGSAVADAMLGKPAKADNPNLPSLLDFAAGSDAPFTTNAAGAGGTTGGSSTSDLSGNEIYNEFMGTIGGSLKNPNALAAVAATGKAESAFSPKNVFRQWSDPSERGQAGDAGGIMSWRADRLNNLRSFAKANGGDPNKVDPSIQAQFFLQEDPKLIASLENSKSPEEAQRLMNNAWRFAGYNREGGEAGRRISLARSFVGKFADGPPAASANPFESMLGQSAPIPEPRPDVQVASLDPSIGFDQAYPAPPLALRPEGYVPTEDVRYPNGNTEVRRPNITTERQVGVDVTPGRQDRLPSMPTPDRFGGVSSLRFDDRGGFGNVGAVPTPAVLGTDDFAGSGGINGFTGSRGTDNFQGRNIQNRPVASAPQAPQFVNDDGWQGQMPAGMTAADFPAASPPYQAGQQFGGSSGPSMHELMQIYSDPRADNNTRAYVEMAIKHRQDEEDRDRERNDPLRKMQMEKGQIELDQARGGTWSKLDDGRLYNSVTGETRDLPGGQAPKWEMFEDPNGDRFRYDPSNPNSKPELFYDAPTKEDSFRTITPDEAKQMGLPPGAYQTGADGKVSQIGGDGTTVNIDQKAEGAFDKKLAEGQAETFNLMANEGINATADMAIIGELDGLLKDQGGMWTGIQSYASQWGVGDADKMDDLQAAKAIISKLVPTQRQPGSGSMSDRDVDLFLSSLPSLWNTQGGNTKILGVMRGLAQYKQGQGEIADQVINGEMSRQEARRALREIPNPLADFGRPKEDTGGTSAPPPVAAPAPTGGPQSGQIEDGYRFKGGNPSDPTNWEPVN